MEQEKLLTLKWNNFLNGDAEYRSSHGNYSCLITQLSQCNWNLLIWKIQGSLLDFVNDKKYPSLKSAQDAAAKFLKEV